jgi:uridine kinase
VTTTPYLVGIAGGSGAGKSALAAAITALLGPARVARLAHDAYYRDRGDLPFVERPRRNFDVPDALDQSLFRAHLASLRRGEPIVPPSYCFVTHRRLGWAEPIAPREIVLVEGILLFHDPDVREALDLKIFVDAPEPLRVARRLARDTAERGRSPDGVLAQWRETVLPAHARYVEPTKALADVVLVNAARLQPVAEVAAALIRERVDTRNSVAGDAHAA